MWEPLICPVILIKSSSLQFFAYFSFHSLAQGLLDSFSHLHQCLAPKFFLRVSGSWRPRPPWGLGMKSLSQATRAHFFFSSPFPQRKSLCIFLICSATPLGIGRADNIYTRRDYTTVVVRASLLARFKDLLVHLQILSFSLLIKASQTSLL